MSSLEERKRQKEEYLAALELQRGNNNDVKSINSENNGGNNDDNVRNHAVMAREKMLEDRKNKFLAKQNNNNAEINLAHYKEEGYPSEYSYALANGALEIRREKVPPPLPMPMPSINGMVPIQVNNREVIQQPEAQKPSIPIPSKVNSNNHMDMAGYIPGNGIAIGVGINGIGQESEDKKAKQREYSRALAEQQQYNNNINVQIDQYVAKPIPNDYIINDKTSKKKRQEEYAQLLKNDQQQPYNDNSKDRVEYGVGVNGIGGVDDRAMKREKQNEYARALAQQNHPANKQPPSYYENEIGMGVNGIGGVDDRAMKREKQTEYARALAQQQQFQQPQQNYPANRQPPSYYENEIGMGVNGIGGVDDRAMKREKQNEYARALAQQQQFQQPQQNYPANRQPPSYYENEIGMGVNGIGGVDDRAMKREKQNEYARALAQQQQFQQPQQNYPANKQPPSYYENEIGMGVNGIGGVDDRAMKREKQNEYARALAQQQQFHFHKQQQELNQANLHVENHGQKPQYSDKAQGNVFGRGGILSMYGNEIDQNDKRRKQQEYARLLQEQQLSLNKEIPNKKFNIAQVQVANNANDPNVWVMGPLGVPVRKTIEVGNRGVQKAFYKASSPTKQPPIAQHFQVPMLNAPYQVPPQQYMQHPQQMPYPLLYPPGHDNLGYQNPVTISPAHSVNSYNNQYAQPPPVSSFPSLIDAAPAALHAPLHPTHMPIGGFDAISGMDNGLSGDSDERAMRARYLQAEQAKGLEDQIRQNKLRVENEKRKQLEDEQKEEERLEKQRIEMQKAFEKENNLAKIKNDEENRRLLELQIQEKKRLKEEEERKEREKEEKENQRIKREQELLRQRGEDEMKRERESNIIVPSSPRKESIPTHITVVSSPVGMGKPLASIVAEGVDIIDADKISGNIMGAKLLRIPVPDTTILLSPRSIQREKLISSYSNNTHISKSDLFAPSSPTGAINEPLSMPVESKRSNAVGHITNAKSAARTIHNNVTSRHTEKHNMFDDEVYKLDKTLASDSKFVFPDGRAYVPPANMDASKKNTNAVMNDSLSSLYNDTAGNLTNPVHFKIKSKINKMYQEEADSDVDSKDVKDDEDFKLYRKNRRRWELLNNSKLGDADGSTEHMGNEELDLLLNEFNCITSRPSTANTSISESTLSRPSTIPNTSRYINSNNGLGYKGSVVTAEQEYTRNRENAYKGFSTKLVLAGRDISGKSDVFNEYGL